MFEVDPRKQLPVLMMRKFRWPLALMIFFLLPLLLLGFENCGTLKPSTIAVSTEAAMEAEFVLDEQTIATVLSSNTLVIWSSAKNPGIVATNQPGVPASISSVPLQQTAQASLAPPTGASAPALLAASGTTAPWMVFAAGNELVPSVNSYLSNAFTVIALYQGPISGTLFTINLGPQSEELSVSVSGNIVAAHHYSDAADFETLKANLPVNSGPIVIAVSFGNQLGSISLMVNGALTKTAVASNGTPITNSVVNRGITLGGSDGAFQLGEILMLSTSMAPYQLNTMSRYLAARWNDFGVIYDPSLVPVSTGPAPALVMPANITSFLNSSCTPCHASGGSSVAFLSYSTSQLISSGLVIAGQPGLSPLYYRLQGATGTTNGPANMPQGGSALPAAELSSLQTWIQSLNSTSK